MEDNLRGMSLKKNRQRGARCDAAGDVADIASRMAIRQGVGVKNNDLAQWMVVEHLLDDMSA